MLVTMWCKRDFEQDSDYLWAHYILHFTFLFSLFQTKDLKVWLCCFSAKYTTLRRKSKGCCLGIMIMCRSGATCLPANCCFIELALYNSSVLVWYKADISTYVTCSRHDIWKITHLSLINNHSLLKLLLWKHIIWNIQYV